MEQLNRIAWIEDQLNTDGIHAIENVLPAAFAGYFKIHLPFAICDTFPVDDYRDEPDTIENMNRRIAIGKAFFEADQWEKIKADLLQPITFRAIAQTLNLEFNAALSYPKMIRKLGKRPVHLQRHLPYEFQFVEELIHLLGSEEQSQFYIYGDHYFEQVDKKYSKEWLHSAPLHFFKVLYAQLNQKRLVPFPLFPNYILGTQRKWCIATGKVPGGHYLLLGVDETLKQKILQQTNWSTIALELADRYI